MSFQLVVHSEDRRDNLLLRNLRDRAKVFVAVMPPASPVNLSVVDFSSEHGSAVSAVELLCQQCRGNCARYLRPAALQECLHPLEFILGDNRFMAVLHEVFGLLTFIPHLPKGDVVGSESLLPDHIPGVGDVGQDIPYRG